MRGGEEGCEFALDPRRCSLRLRLHSLPPLGIIAYIRTELSPISARCVCDSTRVVRPICISTNIGIHIFSNIPFHSNERHNKY